MPVPAWITHADDRITTFDGLDTEQVVSVGRNPAPVNEILAPLPLKEIVGADSTVTRDALATVISNAQVRSVIVVLMTNGSNAIALSY